MKQIKYICDRCLKTFYFEWKPKESKYLIKKNGKDEEIDLCRECRNDFYDWLERRGKYEERKS